MTTLSRPSLAEATRASQDIVAAVGRLRRSMRRVTPDGELTPPQVSVLTLLGKNGAATASSLAAEEGVRPQSMTSTLAVLDDKGLIERHADPNDGRRLVVTLSAAGEAAFRGARTARHAWLTELIRSELTSGEAELLVDAAALLERIARPT